MSVVQAWNSLVTCGRNFSMGGFLVMMQASALRLCTEVNSMELDTFQAADFSVNRQNSGN